MKEKLLNALLSRYRRYKQKNNDNSLQNCIKAIDKMLQKTKFASISSHGENGWCSSRLIQPFVDKKDPQQFSLWFGSSIDSRKVSEIWNNPKVTLAFENTKEDANLVIYGHAVVETAPEVKKHYWKAFLKIFFPNGPLADDYVVIKVHAQRIEIINFKRNITPEPFGLNAMVLLNKEGQWQIA